ncbi:hypothetical protein F4777DRAFT_48942 [Nemania sp. FL0916]|nr:hypothetical protein F4777DRAFT_48942 [Nemania sp. FL0916]
MDCLKLSDAEVEFGRFSDFPTEIRLLIWEHHFDSYFRSPRFHTLNGGFLSWHTGRPDPLSSLRSITSRGRLLKSLADRYGWHLRDVSVLQWKTVIHDLSPVSGKIYTAQGGSVDTWPRLQPFVNHEALDVARSLCRHFEVIDLWLDNSTLNISQPSLVNLAYDVFRIDPGIARMMLGLNSTVWLSRIRRLAIGPFEPGEHFDDFSVLRILEHTRDLIEVYILLSPEVLDSQAWHGDLYSCRGSNGVCWIEVSAEGEFSSKTKELSGPSPGSGHATGDSEYIMAVGRIVLELQERHSSATIMYGCLGV